jgi:hypothetical protein
VTVISCFRPTWDYSMLPRFLTDDATPAPGLPAGDELCME